MTKVKTGKIRHSGILKTIAELFALGKNDYADVILFRDDSFFCDCLKLSAVLSEKTLRQCLNELAQSRKQAYRRNAKAHIFSIQKRP